jgi:hypothetical protein
MRCETWLLHFDMYIAPVLVRGISDFLGTHHQIIASLFFIDIYFFFSSVVVVCSVCGFLCCRLYSPAFWNWPCSVICATRCLSGSLFYFCFVSFFLIFYLSLPKSCWYLWTSAGVSCHFVLRQGYIHPTKLKVDKTSTKLRQRLILPRQFPNLLRQNTISPRLDFLRVCGIFGI